MLNNNPCHAYASGIARPTRMLWGFLAVKVHPLRDFYASDN